MTTQQQVNTVREQPSTGRPVREFSQRMVDQSNP